MDTASLLAINLHKAVGTVPSFCLVDPELRDELQQVRWITLNRRVVRTNYLPDLGRSRPQTLSAFLFELHGVDKPRFIGHLNGDLLDCRWNNLVAALTAGACRTDNTGCEVASILGQFSESEARQQLGFSCEALPAKRGRKGKDAQ